MADANKSIAQLQQDKIDIQNNDNAEKATELANKQQEITDKLQEIQDLNNKIQELNTSIVQYKSDLATAQKQAKTNSDNGDAELTKAINQSKDLLDKSNQAVSQANAQ